MTAAQTHRTTVRSARASRPSIGRVLLGCLVGAAAGAVGLFAYGAVAIAIHGPMHAGTHGADHASEITAASLAIGVVFSTFFGTVLAVALARWARHPARTFLRSAVALTAVSILAPLAASHTDEATRVTLAAGHVIAAAVAIPVIVRALRSPRG